jgi:glycosyltransferase involved in cell wall biosynthesis
MQSLGISCVIPVFNGESYLEETIASVLAQTTPALEIIVIDDGSTDGSAIKAAVFGTRIRYCYQEHCGVSAARNRGVHMAHGELVCFLDADDLFAERKLEIQAERFLERPELEMSIAMTENFWSAELDEDERHDDSVWQTPWAGHLSTWVLRRSLFGRIGGFDETMRLSQDVDWHMRAVKEGAVCEILPRVLSRRRLHRLNSSRFSVDECRAAVLDSTYRHIVAPRRGNARQG